MTDVMIGASPLAIVCEVCRRGELTIVAPEQTAGPAPCAGVIW